MIHQGACAWVYDVDGDEMECAICNDRPIGIELEGLRRRVAELEKPRQIVYSCRFDEMRKAYAMRAEYAISRNLAGKWHYIVVTDKCDVRDAVDTFNEAVRAVASIVELEARRV